MICQFKPKYIDWLLEEKDIKSPDNHIIKCYKLNFTEDNDILNEWALHIRRHYISDIDLEESTKLKNMTKFEYLKKFRIPQEDEYWGSQTITGDICEIIISDVIEFLLKYEVPRIKIADRSGKNNSEHGSDIIAFKFADIDKSSNEDNMMIAEVKSGLSSKNFDSIDKAIKDIKSCEIDKHRYAHTIDYLRIKCKDKNEINMAKIIARFQAITENSCKITFAPATVIGEMENIENRITYSEDFNLSVNNTIVLVHGKELKKLAYNLYRRILSL